MATNPLYPPEPAPVVESGSRLITRPWLLFFQWIAARLAAAGNVDGPTTSTDNAIARWDGTTGTRLQDSGITIADGAAGSLSGTNSGDQDLFKTIAVSGQSDIVADGPTDTLNVAAGSGITLTTNATTDTLTIAASAAGTVTTTGSPASGNLATFSGATSITNGDLSGDVATSGALVTTLASTGVVAGSYTNTSLTVDAKGRITAAANGSSGGTRPIAFTINGGGGVISTGISADVYVPYACTITAVTMLADQSGSVVVDIWKDTYANYPPTVADTITAAAKPTISAATKSQDTTLTGWTTSIAAGDTLRFNIDSASAITRLVLTLTVTL